MQIMPYVAQSLAQEIGIEWGGDRTLFNPFLNIRMGIYYLSRLVLDFDDIGIALAAYNCGPTYVKSLIEKHQRVPDDYYRKVLSVYKSL
jgi:soluble lytic murein transglycosylase